MAAAESDNTVVYTLLDVAGASLRQPDFSTHAPNRTLTTPESRNPDPSRLLESIDFDGPKSVSFGARKKTEKTVFSTGAPSETRQADFSLPALNRTMMTPKHGIVYIRGKQKTDVPIGVPFEQRPLGTFGETFSHKKIPMKPGKFDESLESFLAQFDAINRHNNWSNADKVDFLRCPSTRRRPNSYGISKPGQTFRTNSSWRGCASLKESKVRLRPSGLSCITVDSDPMRRSVTCYTISEDWLSSRTQCQRTRRLR